MTLKVLANDADIYSESKTERLQMLGPVELAELIDSIDAHHTDLHKRWDTVSEVGMDDAEFLDAVNDYREWLEGVLRGLRHVLNPNTNYILLEDLEDMFQDYGVEA